MFVAFAAVVGVVGGSVLVPTASIAAAAGVGTITKELDATQGAGFTAPNTFQTGALVRYRITASCSSNETDCGVGTITDVLDPRLTYVNVVSPTTSLPLNVAQAAGTITITIGTVGTPWPDGNTLEFVVVARVNSSATGTIPNQGTITTTDGPTNQSEIVNIVTPEPVPQWGIDKYKRLPTGNPAVGEDVAYRIEFTVPTIYGNVDILNGVLVDTYPAGATVVSTSPAGVVDTVNHTITWNLGALPAATSMNCANGNGTNCRSYTALDVVLNFPTGSTFDAGEVVNNDVRFAVNYADGSTGVLTDTAPITFAAPAPAVQFFKNGPATTTAGAQITWRLFAENRGNNTLLNTQIVDVLPTGVTGLELWRQYPGYNPIFPNEAAPVVFESSTDGTNWSPWFTYNFGDSWSTQPVPAGATHIRISDAALSPGHALDIYVRATIDPNAATDSTIRNCATFFATNMPNLPAESCVTTTVLDPYATLLTYKTTILPDAGVTSVRPGDEFHFGLLVQHLGPSTISTVELMDQLPPQLEFVEAVCWTRSGGTPDSATSGGVFWWCGQAGNFAPVVPQPEVSTISSPTAGTTLLHWDNLTPPVGSTYTIGQSYVMVIKVRAKESTAVANYINRVNLETDDVRTDCWVQYGALSLVDTQDLDGDGDTTETVCLNTSSVQVREAAVADIYKWVKGNLDLNVAEATGLPDAACPDWDGFTRFPCVATLSPGAPFEYRFRMVNTGNITLTDYTVYDILPHVGDVGVNEALASSQRNTDWVPVMTGPLTVESALPVGANPIIEYNLSYDPCRPEMSEPTPGVVWQAGCNDTWYSAAQITDWSLVKSFRIRMFTDTGATWQPGDEIIMRSPLQAPPTAPTSTQSPLDLSVAWNSVGHQVYRLNADNSTAFLPAAAPRKVGVIVPFVLPDLVRLGNQVWLDTGAGANYDNGVYDTDESPISGVDVELWEDDGDGVFEPALDTFISTTTTDADGNYWFVVDPDTEYFVAIPSGQTGQNGGAFDLQDATSSTGQGTGTTDNDDNGEPTAGYASVSAAVSVPLDGAPTGETDTNDAGSAETEADANVTPLDDNDSDLTIDFGFVRPPDLTFRVGNLVWIDWNNNGIAETGEPGIDGVTVQLLDSVGTVIDTTTTADGGKYLFSDLAAGDYVVRIPAGQAVLAPYVSSSNGEELNPNSNGDNNDNGTTVSVAGVTSGVVTLGSTAIEPTNEVLRSGSATDDDNDAFADNQSNVSVDFGFYTVRIGNQVWLDNGAGANFDNGIYNTDETPISGVDVELWLDDGDNVFEPGAGDTLVDSTTTDTDGNYWFLAQPSTNYFVAIASGQPELATFASSTGSAGGTTDNDDNGAPSAGYASVSGVVNVAPSTAPTGEVDTNDGATTAESEADTATLTMPDANSNLTIDFGFVPTGYDLALIKTRVTASPVQPGATVVWTIRVENQGGTPSGDYTVTDTLPGGMSFVAASNGGAQTAPGSGVVVWNLTGLEPGASVSLTLTTTVADVMKAPFRNWAEISTDSGADDDSTPDSNTGSDADGGTGTAPNDQVVNHNDPDFDSNTETPLPSSGVDEDDNDYEDVDVVVNYDLALAKVTTASSVEVGTDVTWTIRIQNQGNVASGVYTVTDRLPAGMSFVSCSGATSCAEVAGVVTYTMPTLAPGAFANVTLVTKVTDMNLQPFRNWAEISADGADAYDILNVRNVEDDDSIPDTNSGSDTAYGPAMGATDNGGANDLYVGVTDLTTLATDGPAPAVTDEDDHDDAIVSGAVHYDLALIKTVNTTSVVEGGQVTWTITVRNQGNVSSGLYTVTDTIPGGMSYDSSTPTGSHSAGIVTWANRPSLAPGAEATFTLTTTADNLSLQPFRNWAEISADGADGYDLTGLDVEDEDSVPDTNTGSDSGAGSGTAPNDAVVNHNDITLDTPAGDEDDNDYEEVGGDVEYDLALVKVVDNTSPVQPGDTITWRIAVRNQGNVSSGVYTVTDTIPTGLTYGTCAGATSCGAANGVVTFTMPNLAPGAQAVITYTTTIADVNEAPFRNWAEISDDSAQELYGVNDDDSTPNTDTGEDSTLPDDDYVSIVDLDDVLIDEVVGDEDDNDDASVDVQVVYDLALAKVTSQATVSPTNQVVWTIRVQNQGNVPSGAFDVTDTLPTGMTFVTASNGGTAANGVVTWSDLASLAPGAFIDLTVTTSISDPTQRPFRNWAEISADSADFYDQVGGRDVEDKDSTPDTDTGADQTLPLDEDYVGIDSLSVISSDGLPTFDEDDNDDASVDITVEYDLALIKTVAAGPFEYGDDVTYTITVVNQGNVPSGVYDVTDTLPAGLTFVSASNGGVHSAGVVTWSDLPSLAPAAQVALTLVVEITDGTQREYRNWAEISADSADDYDTLADDVEDADSTPDTDTGTDEGPGTGDDPNDDVDNHNDISLDEPVGDEDDNDFEDIDIVVEYDLALAKVVVNTSPVQPSDFVNWEIRVRNQGTVPSGLFDVTDTIPAGMTFVSADNGGTSNGQTVTWADLPSLEPGEELTLTVTTAIVAVRGDDYRNWAEISADSADDYSTETDTVTDDDSMPDTETGADETLPADDYVGIDDLADVETDQIDGDEDDNDDALVRVNIVYDLALVKSIAAGQRYKVGDSISFTITVKNQGNVDSGPITVQDVIPAGLAFVSTSDGGLNNGQVVTWSLPNLAPDETHVFTLIVRMTDATKTSYINFSEIVQDGADQYDVPGLDVEDEDSVPDTDITNDPLIDTDDVNIDQIPGDEDDHDRALLDVAKVRSDNPRPGTIPGTGSNTTPLLWGGVMMVAIGLLATSAARRRRQLTA